MTPSLIASASSCPATPRQPRPCSTTASNAPSTSVTSRGDTSSGSRSASGSQFQRRRHRSIASHSRRKDIASSRRAATAQYAFGPGLRTPGRIAALPDMKAMCGALRLHRTAACGSARHDGTVRLWNLTKGTADAVMRGHEGDVQSVAYSPDSNVVASAGRDGTVRLWDPKRGLPTKILHQGEAPFHDVAFSPDGWSLAASAPRFRARVADERRAAAGDDPCRGRDHRAARVCSGRPVAGRRRHGPGGACVGLGDRRRASGVAGTPVRLPVWRSRATEHTSRRWGLTASSSSGMP